MTAPHETVGFSIRDADDVTHAAVGGGIGPEYFGQAIEKKNVTGLKVERFVGEAARPRSTKGM